MKSDRTVLVVLAHPDDENGMGGTLARYASEGVRVVLACATRGEVGTIFDPTLATPETIASVREQELHCSCAALGIELPLFLDCGDGAVRECSDVALEKVVRLVRQLRPQIIISFGPDGIYGHPDHVAVHHLATKAWGVAGDPATFPEQTAEGLAPYAPARLFYRELPQSLIDRWRQFADLTVELNGAILPIAGVPDEKMSAVMDVTPMVVQKATASACHRTQMNPNSPMRAMPEGTERQFMNMEHFVLGGGTPLPPGISSDLFAGL
jgi:N-acetyl-1-D-myo-inositol-2-amino-2-deoxy-alpha-D-glucopyranoside deacetylase